ncbi:MAG: NAD(P)/FAD-dependent oxidoreductase [Candidatus Hadarchaeales archaeon]
MKVEEFEERVRGDPSFSRVSLRISLEGEILFLEGETESWEQVVELGHLAAGVEGVRGIVNRLWPRGLPKPERKREGKGKAAWDGMRADVVVVGAGIVGAGIARELSRYELEVVLVEKEEDVAWGQSKGGASWIHGFAGLDVDPTSLKAKLCVEGNALYDEWAEELDFSFKRPGLLAVVMEEELVPLLEVAAERVREHGCPVRVIGREELHRMEPGLPPEAAGALFFPTYGVVAPYEVTIALVENAVANGVKLLLGTEVIGVRVEEGRVKGVITDRGEIFTSFLVNAAGLYSDEVAELAGAPEFTIHPRKGEMLLIDWKRAGACLHNLAPGELKEDPYTKGGGISLTVDGNMLWGPTAQEVPYKEDTETTKEGMERVWRKFSKYLPSIKRTDVITAFAGVRAATYTEDFHIAPSRKVKGLVNVGGIQSPGITAAPAIARMVVDILRKEGLELREKVSFNPRRRAAPRFRELGDREREQLISLDRRYGRVVCRCEHVTEGEVVEAIRRGATTLDGIKFRTRAGMGRCQGGFCTPHLLRILSRELGRPVEELTKKGGKSRVVMGRIKEPFLGG